MSHDIYSHLSTEQPHPDSMDLDLLTPLEFVELMQSEDEKMLRALNQVNKELAECIEELSSRLRAGGRLFYCGAGTSGRLGMLDAVECPPTFGTRPELVQTILAGGYESLIRSVEGAEDDETAGREAVSQRGIRSGDFVCGIAASSTTLFVRGVLREASSLGAYTLLLTCNPVEKIDFPLQRCVVLPTGQEVLTGSTRLKAGTATKLFLNRLTTGTMIQLGKVYQNRMVDLYLTCNKLRARAVRTTCELTGLLPQEAQNLLEQVGGSVKLAILVYRKGISPEAGLSLLKIHNGSLRHALESTLETKS